jgi:hypothetical protein
MSKALKSNNTYVVGLAKETATSIGKEGTLLENLLRTKELFRSY